MQATSQTMEAQLQIVSLDRIRAVLAAREERRSREAAEGAARVKVIALANGKGGVGKSSTAAAFAAAAAAQNVRVCLMELDPQGNNAEDLGFNGTAIADDGRGQATAVLSGTGLQPSGEPRRNLHVVPGGEALEEVTEELYCQRRLAAATGDPAWLGMYAAAIEQVYDDYDLIILDVAPGSLVLQLQALIAADAVIVPSKSDPSSRKGLKVIARRFMDARPFNEGLTLLGVVLFATGSSATRVKSVIRAHLEKDLDGAAPVFDTDIRHVEAVAVQARLRGLVPQELAKEKELDSGLRKSAVDLAKDYQALTTEILQRIASLVNELNGEEEVGA
ncbi:ParA family protein [Actinomadura sp. NPDC048955]|uniref:ParA family protein n=1 Tax=Actinomadura sp. NPDC048955 TaxID=3158228 RepID=UPI0033D4C5FE